jgi:hypothetical protein
MIAFIDDHREAHGVEPVCKVLQIAPSTYHARVAQRRDIAKAGQKPKHAHAHYGLMSRLSGMTCHCRKLNPASK